ncbi:glycosyltransferase [Pseudooceanicola sp. CBS1P-1]|uniref:Glycosyltransferase n=1 Tax=Pseudooceanicola albus TaxID=2692189 RepID=A0A6L7G408_9RHOB|nr:MULTISPECIES: glycosyltransferase family 2 protein [Pseudooceanicola]MBT9384820.1 glycosyltransferase [Pseudooceanicola endophyticus]MXN18186.1 glycosyltransferase [Pseudooceanicola albus]
MDDPEVSVIIPACHATATLPRALASVTRCGLPPERVEVVIASDDGRDYAALMPPAPGLVFTAPGPVRSGPGPARNRALAQARGRFLAFLDSDDEWEPGYLAALLPLARRHGAAFGQTAILDAGVEILRLPQQDPQLDLTTLAETGASFHPVMARAQARPFSALPSQDVRHAAELIARLGGAAPLGPAGYRLHLAARSTTAQASFPERVARAYAAHAEQVLSGLGDVPAPQRAAVARVFTRKAALNTAYQKGALPGQSFYHFMAARLAPPPLVAAR